MSEIGWAERLQEKSKGTEFYGPTDPGNPAPGQWTVIGPTGKEMSSTVSIDRAAFLFLVQFARDPEAREAMKEETASR